MLRSTSKNAKPSQKGKGKSALPSKRPRAASTSSSGSNDESDDDVDAASERQAMLAALEARSRAMLGLEPIPEAESSTQAQRRRSEASDSGIVGTSEVDSDEEAEDFSSDDGWGAEDGFVSDSEDELAAVAKNGKSKSVIKTTVAPAQPTVPEVVFDDTLSGRTKRDPMSMSASEKRAFLNGNTAKLMGVKIEQDYGPRPQKRTRAASEEEEDQSNLKLDRTLHDMLLTGLIPDSVADSASRPVEKRNAMTSRLLELASYELPGQGSKTVSTSHFSSHPAHIRTGMLHAKTKREEKAIAEAKAAGNYHKGLGGLEDGGGRRGPKGKLERRAEVGVETGKKKGMEGRKKGDSERGRGLGIGVGRFEGGMLRLTEREIAKGSGESGGGGSRFKGKGKKGKRR
ncbi:hypothetical protein CI109_105882 [Kwoniella shandongensis]|uniref:Protein FAF1 n=1 Tax=Kwoniella shandongensis TaxID=1734106 RepID=A0A5M6BSV7_9TREE|nr:uncharacterized protein CI109_005683 [Kwoniella shandongensis]KAA5525936.1 hypothetical protein CI109_005683 [Kwoniella shandongensis]